MNDREKHLENVQRWLNDCTQVDLDSNEELNIFGTSITNDPDLLASLCVILENTSFHAQFLEPICKHLFVLYNTRVELLRLFVWSLIPSIIGVHLTSDIRIQSTNCSTKSQCTDVLLLAIYNQEVVNDEGFLKQKTFRVPNLSRSSVYHEVRAGSNIGNVSQSDLFKRPDAVNREQVVPAFGPYSEQDQLNLANRNSIICVLLKCFNDHLTNLPRSSCAAFCRMCNRLLASGLDSLREDRWSGAKFDKSEPLNLSELLQKCSPRVQFTPNLLLQMLNCLYYCLYNGSLKEARHAVMEIHRRAMTHLYSEVLLMTNAILNSLEIPAGAKLEDDCMRLSVALSPTSNSVQSIPGPGKTAITNASFKTQILPEDIPIVPSSIDELNTINEDPLEESKETPENGKPTGSSNRNIFLGNKDKRKEKKDKEKKDKDKDKSKHHKHSSAGITESNDAIAMSVLQSGLNLESKTSATLLTNCSLISPNSASTGNLENALDQLRIESTGEAMKCNDLDANNIAFKSSLSASPSIENVKISSKNK